jgi:methyl-accepting chemotaxis protein
MLTEVRNNSQQTAAEMATVTAQSASLKDDLTAVTDTFIKITQDVQSASAALEQIEQSSIEFQTSSTQIDTSIGDVTQALANLSDRGTTLSKQAGKLSLGAEGVFRELDVVPHDNFFSKLLSEARSAAQNIGDLFAEQVKNGQISEPDLFSQNYRPIANTNPTKFSTPFDSLTDRLLPTIQEPILERHQDVLYAGAVDRKGYFPTHNKRYSHPLTGDYERDLVNNRTKRIFDDATGGRCGAHTESFLLQTYKRDTGDVLHDLSVPIYVNGKHWGGFRIGFKSKR